MLMNFQNLYEAVEDIIKIPAGSKRDIAKHVVNMAYLEMLHADDQHPLFWLRRLVDNLVIRAPLTIAGITAATPPVVTVSSLSKNWDDNLVIIHGVSGMTEINARVFLVDDTNTVARTFELQDLTATDIVGASYTAYTSGGYVYHTGLKLSSGSIDKLLEMHVFDPSDSTEYDPLELVLPEKFEGEWSENDSRPDKAMLMKENQSGTETNFLFWNSSDDNYGIRLWKTIPGVVLSATTDIPLLPTEYHYGIVAGAAMRLIENNVQVENAVIWPGIYKVTVEQLISHNRRLWKQHESGRTPFLL
jgi:hypothetical protein